jgi:hypothetical protein
MGLYHRITLAASATFLFTAMGCVSNYTFSNTQGDAGSGSQGSLSSGGSGGSGSYPNSTTSVVRSLQPALAVRGSSCVACHMNVQANFITDFGNGNAWYLDQDKGGWDPANDYPEKWYVPYALEALENVTGQIIVPSVNVPGSLVSATIHGQSSAMGLASYMMAPGMTDFASEDLNYFNTPAPQTMAIAQNVVPPAGQSAVIAQQPVYIGAPTASEIEAIQATPASSISGFTTAQGNSGSYTTNSGPVQCAGQDVVVNGTLLLNQLQIYAGNGGCRLYVTGSVFIEGPITYLQSGSSADPTTNLQITSSTSIIMGVGLSGKTYLEGADMSDQDGGSNPLDTRLLADDRNLEFRSAPNSSAYNSWANGVYAEGTNIGANLLLDASNVSNAAQTAVSAAGQTRQLINFEHLLLNAPVIHSRYLGNFQGIIVAEVAEMALGDFAFSYDLTFAQSSVAVLPALPYDILCVGSSQTCNPAQQ